MRLLAAVLPGRAAQRVCAGGRPRTRVLLRGGAVAAASVGAERGEPRGEERHGGEHERVQQRVLGGG